MKVRQVTVFVIFGFALQLPGTSFISLKERGARLYGFEKDHEEAMRVVPCSNV
jgi:hypothetical protein